MNDGPEDSIESATRPVRPPPLPLNADTLGPGLRSPPAPPPPTNWKRIGWIIGLSLAGMLGFVVLVGALLFGGCMWLVKQANH